MGENVDFQIFDLLNIFGFIHTAKILLALSWGGAEGAISSSVYALRSPWRMNDPRMQDYCGVSVHFPIL